MTIYTGKIFKGITAGMAAGAIMIAAPAIARTMSQAEKLRRMDIMLMVTSLRCRSGGDNFQADYGRFTTHHIVALNAASNSLKTELSGRYGAAGAPHALDRLSVTMANSYGQGHPWLNCAQLKQVVSSLVAMQGAAALQEAADQLLAERGTPQFAWARH